MEQNKQWLICVDSDGCVMDTMNSKHKQCFGPALVEQWELERWRGEILDRWNSINLYSMTRGINRYKGLAKALEEIDRVYTPITGVEWLCRWAESARELSAAGVRRAAEECPDRAGRICLQKALAWSEAADRKIENLPPEEQKPFPGAAQALAEAHSFAAVAVVSSANKEAVLREWSAHGLLPAVDEILAQDQGSKAFCIGKLLQGGYRQDRTLMIGDAPGDLDAARACGVYFYPILVGKEQESWEQLTSQVFPQLLAGGYAEIQPRLQKAFLDNLQK